MSLSIGMVPLCYFQKLKQCIRKSYLAKLYTRHIIFSTGAGVKWKKCECGVVQDLKSSNVLLTSDGHAKIADVVRSLFTSEL